MRKLSARALVDDSAEALEHAKAEAAAGDESWEQWLSEYHRGDALILCLELTLEFAGADEDVIHATSGGLFIENDMHVPKVEQQVAELVSGDLADLVRAATARGYDIDVSELGQMYVHVELAPEVLHRLAGALRGVDQQHQR